MTTLSKTKSISKRARPALSVAPPEDDLDSWGDSDSELQLSDWSDDDWNVDDVDDEDVSSSSVAKRKTVTKQKKQKSIVQVARSGKLEELQALLSGMGQLDVAMGINEPDAKNYCALHYAAHSDNLAMVKLLIEHGADVDRDGEADRTPLHFAAAAKKEQSKQTETQKRMSIRRSKIPDECVVKALLSKDADPNAVDNRGRTPLHVAVLQGNVEAVAHLLAASSIKMDEDDHRSMTPLIMACLYGKTEIAQLLVEKGADLTDWDDNLDTPLNIAFREGHRRIVRCIIEKAKETGQLKELLIETNRNSIAPIHEAVRGGHKELLQLCLEHVLGADATDRKDDDEKDDEKDDDDDDDDDDNDEDVINYGGENDDTPLHEAAHIGNLDIVKMLVAKGAKIDVTNWDNHTPLHYACAENHQKVAEYLVEKGADLSKTGDDMMTPLQVAADAGSADTIISLIDRFRTLNTGTSARENDADVASELLKWSAEENKARTLQLLLNHGSKLHGVSDDDIVEYVLNAASKGHKETVAVLIRWKRSDVVGTCDNMGNSPLHLAAEAGHDVTVQELIKAKADVNDCNYDDGLQRTPLHLAAANGWTRTVKQLVKNRADVDETDMYKITPLDLACQNGHIDMVKLLMYDEKADILLRDKQGLNCLDYAIDNGHEDIANLILSHDKWREVMSVSSLDDDTWERTTPMRKLIKKMPDLAKRVMDKCVQVAPDVGPKDHDFWVEFYYEFLEDSFSNWDRPKDSDDEDEDDDDDNGYDDDNGDDDDDGDGDDDSTKETSFISKPNGRSSSEGKDNDDSDANDGYDDNSGADDKDGDQKKPTKPKMMRRKPEDNSQPTGDAYDATGKLKLTARPYTARSKDIALNHPLNIMVSSQRADLLSHPLVSSLLSYKWNRVGQFFFWASLCFYLLFVAMLTAYVIVVPPSYYLRYANTTDGVTWFVNGEQRWVGEFSHITLYFFGHIGDWIIMILSLINLLREVFQLVIQRKSYFGFGNLLEWSLYVLAILLVLPLSNVDYYNGVSVRLDWQWQCGAVAVFLAWINLILFARRFSGIGIYVIMFIDILRTFMKFVIILILFVIAFAMAFYTLLMNQEPFHRVGYSFAKTFVMMIGELDFGDIFHSQNYLGTENTLEQGEEDFFLSKVFYEGITYTIFTLFLVIMSILIMNLLVGLAVDDIHAIQEKAKLHRLAMQVELVMEVQQALPIFIWRSSVLRNKRFYLHRARCGGVQKGYRTLTGDQDLLREAMEVCDKPKGDFMHQPVTTDQLFNNLKYRLKVIDTKVVSVNERVEEDAVQRRGEMVHIRSDQKQLRERFDRLEKKLDALLNHSQIKWEETETK